MVLYSRVWGHASSGYFPHGHSKCPLNKTLTDNKHYQLNINHQNPWLWSKDHQWWSLCHILSQRTLFMLNKRNYNVIWATVETKNSRKPLMNLINWPFLPHHFSLWRLGQRGFRLRSIWLASWLSGPVCNSHRCRFSSTGQNQQHTRSSRHATWWNNNVNLL